MIDVSTMRPGDEFAGSIERVDRDVANMPDHVQVILHGNVVGKSDTYIFVRKSKAKLHPGQLAIFSFERAEPCSDCWPGGDDGGATRPIDHWDIYCSLTGDPEIGMESDDNDSE